MFTQDDAVLLGWIIDQFAGVVTTAHIVTEASNLGNALSSYSRVGWFAALASFSTATREETRSLTSLSNQPEFVKFGLTDCAIADLAEEYQVLTMDRGLSNHCVAQGRSALSFEDLRQMV